jgi:hypothetical protein
MPTNPTFTAAPDDIPSRDVPSTFSVLTDPFLVWTKTFRDQLSSSVAWFTLQVTTTGNNVIATAADAVQTALDRIATAADAVQTALDRIATGNDVTATGNNLAAFQEDYIGKYANDAAANASGFTVGDGVFYGRNVAPKGLRVYFDGAWGAAVLDANGALMAANDLSDISSVENARANLGIVAPEPVAYATIVKFS